MPRLMSMTHTEHRVRDRSKTVTRRLGWLMLKSGDPLTLVRKSQGRRRKDGTLEPLVRLAEVEVVSIRREPLYKVTTLDVALEGFPGWSPQEFIAFFMGSMKCPVDQMVTRIEFRYLDEVTS